ncbi:cytochrome c oxidase subunit 3 [bacterium]|nr:cytochrome c oxidase subunit 3 [bacterium]
MGEFAFEPSEPLPGRSPPYLVGLSRSRFHPVELATYIFMLSLAVFFAASLLAYVIIRLSGDRVSSTVPIGLPTSIWLSTAALLVTSFCLSRALSAVRREKQLALRRWLFASAVLGFTFLAVQGWSVLEIMDAHLAGLEKRMSLYGVVFFLVALHAVHVLGGMFCLSTVTLRGFQHRYDHECYRGIKLCTAYWHFLDIVWILMLVTFLATAS